MKKNNNFPITATFIDEITYDIPSQNWTDEQWTADFDNMQEVGIDTLVVMRGCFYDKCIYPSKIFPTLKKDDEDFAHLIFSEAQKRNMQVYMGLYISNLCWNEGDFLGEVRKNKLYIDEIMQRYGDFSSFKGWYIPHETGHNAYNVKETMSGLTALCKDKTPDKSIFISPFFRSPSFCPDYLSPSRTAEEWNNIWEKCGKDIDICAFQDGTVSLNDYQTYFQAIKEVCDAHKISLWSNVETFERDVRQMFYPIPFDILRKKIELAEPYVDGCITFEFSHFLSPQSIYPSAKNLNTLYRKYYEKKITRDR